VTKKKKVYNLGCWLARHICLGYDYATLNKANHRNSQDRKRTVEGESNTDDDAIQVAML